MSCCPPDAPLYYLVGRMSDQDDLHVLEFLRARDTILLRKRKGRVVIPHVITGRDPIDYVHEFQATPPAQRNDLDHQDYSNSVRYILDNRPIIIALKSWYLSPGAKTELAVAIRLGLTVLFWDGEDFYDAPAEFDALVHVIEGHSLRHHVINCDEPET